MFGTALTVLVSLVAPAARAEPQTPDPEVVELYRKGRELVKAGNWDEGCPKFELAMTKQPTTSILINVGDCHLHQGKLAKAMEDYEIARALNRETLGEARRVALESEIEMRVKKLEPRIPKLRIIIENPVADMVVECDGVALERDKIGVDVPMDPGEHVLTAEGSGAIAKPQRITLKEGATERLTLRLAPRSFVSQHRASLGLAVSAVVLAGAGGALAGWTVSSHSTVSETCGASKTAECDGLRADVEIGSIATNVAFAAAGAAAVAAVVVFAVGERPKAPKAQVAISGTFATLRVAF